MDIDYVKYNSYRREEFSLKTVVATENGKRFTLKRPLSKKAEPFVQQILENGLLLESVYHTIQVCPRQIKDGSIFFPWVEGITFQEMLLDIIDKRDKKAFVECVFKYQGLIGDDSRLETMNMTCATEKFEQIFGKFPIGKYQFKAVPVSNIDLSFENLIFSNNQWVMIDYEWVFSFPIPIKYILYRNLGVFYAKFFTRIDKGRFVSYEEILKLLDITQEEIEIFVQMECHFQEYVHAKNCGRYDQYLKRPRSLEHLLDLAAQMEASVDRAKLYWRLADEDYSEERTVSVKTELDGSQEACSSARTKIDLPCKGEWLSGSSFRVDVSTRPCAFQIKDIYLADEFGERVVSVEQQSMNNNLLFGGYAVFLSDDTQIICNPVQITEEQAKNARQLVLELEFTDLMGLMREYEISVQQNEIASLQKLEQQVEEYYIQEEARAKQASDYEQRISDYEQRISNYEQEISELKQNIAGREYTLNQIYQSRGWKFIECIRKLLGK